MGIGMGGSWKYGIIPMNCIRIITPLPNNKDLWLGVRKPPPSTMIRVYERSVVGAVTDMKGAGCIQSTNCLELFLWIDTFWINHKEMGTSWSFSWLIILMTFFINRVPPVTMVVSLLKMISSLVAYEPGTQLLIDKFPYHIIMRS